MISSNSQAVELPSAAPGDAQQCDTSTASAPDNSTEEARAQEFVPSPEEEARILRAEACKAEGNDLYKQGEYREAIAKYWQAVDLVPRAAPQRAVYYANLAAASLQLQEYKAAVEQCNAALAAQPAYVKALVRRATALEQLDNLEQALTDAKQVLELDPSSSWAAGAVVRLEPAVARRQEALREEMMGKLKELGNSVLGRFGMSLDNFKAEKDPASGGYSIKFTQ